MGTCHDAPAIMVTRPLGMLLLILSLAAFLASAQLVPPECPDYGSYSNRRHAPFSEGVFQLSYQRPEPRCRTFNLTEVEETITSMKEDVKDPDLFRLFENCFPNTLDTAITWKGVANGSSGVEGEEVSWGSVPGRRCHRELKEKAPLILDFVL